jgi:hypothetical protein
MYLPKVYVNFQLQLYVPSDTVLDVRQATQIRWRVNESACAEVRTSVHMSLEEHEVSHLPYHLIYGVSDME